MAKMSELDMVLKELRVAAQAITNAADNLAEFYSGKPTQPVPEPGSPTLNEPETAPATSEPEKAAEVTEPMKLALRAIANEKVAVSDDCKAKIKALLNKYGIRNLTAVLPNDYAAFKTELEGL